MTRTTRAVTLGSLLLCSSAAAAAEKGARAPSAADLPLRVGTLADAGGPKPGEGGAAQSGSAGASAKRVDSAVQASATAPTSAAEIEALRAAAQAAPRDARALHQLGLGLLARGTAEDLQSAQPMLQQAATLDPRDPAIALDLAVAQVRSGQLQAAERQLKQLCTREPPLAPAALAHSACFDHGVVLSAQGRHEAAIEAYERAARVVPQAETLFNLAEAYLRRFDRARAIDAYRRALTVQPDYLPAANNLAKALLDSGDSEGALRTLSDAMARGGERDPELHYNRAIALSRKSGESAGAALAAIEEYRKAVALRPDYAEAHNNLGVLLGATGGNPGVVEMLREFQAALKARPRYALASYNLGVVLLARGEPDAAIVAFRDALQDDPKMADAYRGLGDAYFAKGKVRPAKDAYMEALRLNPQDAETQRQISLALVRSGSPAEALRQLRDLVQQSPQDGRTRFYLGKALAETGDAAGAEREYREALRYLKDRDAEVTFALAELLGAQGRGKEALAQYEATLKSDPNYAPAWFRIAQGAAGSGDYGRATEGFLQAAKLEPRLLAEAYLHLGEVYFRRRQPQQEIEAYQKALRAREGYGEARAELAFALHRERRYDEALAEARRAVKDAPDYARAHYYLGVMLVRQRAPEEALAALRRALLLAPDMAEAHLAIGQVLWRVKKDRDGARAALQAALKTRPEYPEAKDALQALEAGKDKPNDKIGDSMEGP